MDSDLHYPPYPPHLDLVDVARAPEPWLRALLLRLCGNELNRAIALHWYDRLSRYEADARGSTASVASSSGSFLSTGGGEELGITTETATAAAAVHGTGIGMSIGSGSGSTGAFGNPRKRKKTGNPKICIQCDNIYTEEENELGKCLYHAGTSEVFDERKISDDWNDPAEFDTPECKARFPDAFRWTCCHRSGPVAQGGGCRKGRHEANPDRARHGRDSDSQGSSLDYDPLSLGASMVMSQAETEQTSVEAEGGSSRRASVADYGGGGDNDIEVGVDAAAVERARRMRARSSGRNGSWVMEQRGGSGAAGFAKDGSHAGGKKTRR